MDIHYNSLADRLALVCPKEFQKAWVEAEVDTDYASTIVWCQLSSSTIQPEVSGETAFAIGDALIELNQAMTVPGQTPWSKCKFTLFPDGNFTFDVEYDD
jgi:hypothetical protein